MSTSDGGPVVERVGRSCWYAADVHALLANPCGLPPDMMRELQAWSASNDFNVQHGRPFCIDGSSYSFDWFYRRDFAPQWWVERARAWAARHGFDQRGQRGAAPR